MSVILKIIICFITILIPVSGLECELHIALEGNGYLYEHTNMGEAKEIINAHGEQTYDRYYVNQDVRGLYVSNYSLMKYWPNNESRTYAISAGLPGGLIHFAEINSKEGIFASNWIDNNNKTVATKFQISGNGSLSEGVATKGSRGHYNFLEETSAIGKVKLLSGIKNDVQIIPDSDADRLKNSLDSVSLTSESGKIDISFPETIVFINGEKRSIIKSDQRISEIVGDRQVELISPYGISSESNKSEQIDKLKNKNTSIIENFNGNIIAWPNESKDKVDILDLLEIDSTNLAPGNKANFSLTVFNTGSLGLTRVSVAIHLPPELNYADSNPEGIYQSGDIYWPNIGEIQPDDKVALNFSAVIKNVLPYTINKLNCTGEIIAIAQDGTTMAKPIFRRLSITQPYLSIEKYADKTAISVGQMVTYTMNMRNIGNVVLHNISVIEKMADGMEFISSTSGFLNSSNGSATCNYETLLPGEMKTLTYVAKATGEFFAGRMLQSIVYVTAKTDSGLLARAENISEILLLSNNSKVNTTSLNQILRIKEVPETEKKLDLINFNFTSNSDKVVHTGDEIIFDINLSPIGKSNLDNVSMYINVDKGLDIIQLPFADFTIKNNTIYWPKINLSAGNWHGSFDAKVKNTNVNTERMNIIARLINGKDNTTIGTKSIELKFELNLTYHETDYSIIAQQKEDLVQEREVLVRDHRQLGKKLIWDTHSWVGRVVPRPEVVDPFIDEIPSDNVDTKSPTKILRIGRV